MDWLRRNWPDLLIGLALIAVIAGIVSTLLTGGSFFPSEGPGGTPAASTSSPSTTSPAAASPSDGPANGSADPSDAPSVGDPSVGDPSSDRSTAVVVTPPGAPDPNVASTPAGAGSSSATSSAASGAPTVTVTPLAPGDDRSSVGGGAGSTSTAASSSSSSTPATAVRPGPAASATPATSASGAASRPTEPFRISVGAFSVRDNAQRQAERFRADGYPVFLGEQGALTLVLVGPYTAEAEALRVAREIATDHPEVEPVVYEFRPEGGRADATVVTAPSGRASSDPASPTVSSPGGGEAGATRNDVPSASAASPSLPATTDGTSFQVGAFSSSEAATDLLSALASLGFAPTEVRESGLVKIVVGPFAGQAADDARTILDGAGIDYFQRR